MKMMRNFLLIWIMSNKIEKSWAECTPTETRIYTIVATEIQHEFLHNHYLAFKQLKNIGNRPLKWFLTHTQDYMDFTWKEEIKPVKKQNIRGYDLDCIYYD